MENSKTIITLACYYDEDTSKWSRAFPGILPLVGYLIVNGIPFRDHGPSTLEVCDDPDDGLILRQDYGIGRKALHAAQDAEDFEYLGWEIVS